MKYPFVFLLLILVSCEERGGQKTVPSSPQGLSLPTSPDKVGVGLIHFNTDVPLLFYKSPGDKMPYDTLSFEEQKTGPAKGICLFKTKVLKDKLSPYALSGGDSEQIGEAHRHGGLFRFRPELAFRVVAQQNDGFVVVVNEKTVETSSVRVSPQSDLRKESKNAFFDFNFFDTKIADWYFYQTWGQFLKISDSVKTADSTCVYDQPEGQLKAVLRDTEAGGNYFRIDSVRGDWARLTNVRYEVPGSKKVKGWVKWRDANSMKLEGIKLGYD